MTYEDGSKYKGVERRVTSSPDGRAVTVSAAPAREDAPTMGWMRRRQGMRLDLLAHAHLGGAPEWWRLADHNNQMLPDAVLEQTEIAVPVKARDR